MAMTSSTAGAIMISMAAAVTRQRSNRGDSVSRPSSTMSAPLARSLQITARSVYPSVAGLASSHTPA